MLSESVVLGILAATIRNGNMRFLKFFNAKYLFLPITAFLFEFICSAIVFRNILGLRLFMNEYYMIAQIIIYAMLFIFCCFNLNKRMFAIILVGIFLNFAVIAANDGMMPVKVDGALSQGYSLQVDQLEKGLIGGHIPLDEKTTRISMLGDVIDIRPPYPFPKTISVGDIVISVGVFLLIFNTKEKEEEIVC